VRAGHAAGLTVDVCGEAGSDPTVLPVLVGLGVDELSVAAARVGDVRQWVRELDYATCRNAARQLLDEAAHARRERV
jgi:multiphosphoryl transfer protein